MNERDAGVEANIAFAYRIGDWLNSAKFPSPEMGVDFADLVFAAKSVEQSLAELVTLNPKNAEQADVALSLAGDMAAQLFTELRGHLDSLQGNWEEFEDHLAEMCSPEKEDR